MKKEGTKMQLVVDKIAKSFGINEIFKDISFMVDKGEKIGLVGVNGSGKTTLLRCLLKPSSVDVGVVRFEPGLKIGYVEQGFQNMGDGSLWEFMMESCPEIIILRKQMLELEHKTSNMQPGQEQELLLNDYAKVIKQYEHLDGYNYEILIKKVLIGLGFLQEVWDKPSAKFSGGQKTRIMLASALVRKPDFLILDEPTNHLDIVMTEWLENYLKDFSGGLLVVSHDRSFLDNISTRILEMEGGKISSFKGNYTRYLAQKDIKVATLDAAFAAQQDYIARTEAYIRRFKAGIKSKMARGRQSQLDRLERLDVPVHNDEFELRLPPAPESAERVLILENLSVGYGETVLLEDINLVLRKGEKVGLLGANGTGKTTLLKTILGELKPLTGVAQIGNRVKIGYFSQSYERLDSKQTLLENFLVEYGFTEERTRSLLGGMLFHGDEVFKTIGTLSGGQKARLVLLKLVLDGANCLILDEPTNHLDIMARETVEAALSAFDGTLLVVSHDRYFIQEIADRIWDLNKHHVDDYKGDYAFYLEQKNKAREDNAEVIVTEKQKDKNSDSKLLNTDAKHKNKKHYSQQELDKLLAKVELNIREQEAMMKVLEQRLADPQIHLDPEISSQLGTEHVELKNKIDELMVQWEELMAAAEDLEESNN